MRKDVTGWFTKQEAADLLCVSTKAIERFVHAGRLTQRFRPQPGAPHLAVYFPEDVMRVKAERLRPEPPPRVLPPEAPAATNGNGPHDALLAPADVQHMATLVSLFRAILGKDASQTSHLVSQTAKWLTVEEAAEYLNWPVRDVRRAIKAGELPARPMARHGMRIRRKDLDAL